MTSNKYKDINCGDPVVCINDQKTIHITKDKTYSVLSIYKSKNRYYFRVEDDGEYVNSYEATRFISFRKNRETLIEQIIN
jgi:hypothetical protein